MPKSRPSPRIYHRPPKTKAIIAQIRALMARRLRLVEAAQRAEFERAGLDAKPKRP